MNASNHRRGGVELVKVAKIVCVLNESARKLYRDEDLALCLDETL